MQGETRAAFALIRPPGHHATPKLPMGFCLFNNAAIAVRSARNAGAARVAIIDIDVHHGNGTQDIFYADPTVLYTSLHQFPWYPGTGQASERGDPGASGTTLNVPLPAGTDKALDGSSTSMTWCCPRWRRSARTSWSSAPGTTRIVMTRLPSFVSRTRRTRRSLSASARSRRRSARDDPFGSSKAGTTFEQSPLRWQDACACSPPDASRPAGDRRGECRSGDRGMRGFLRARRKRREELPTAVPVATPSPTAQLVGTSRTVLSPLGLRIHSVPVLASTNVVGGFSQGRTFTVLGYQSGGGGWFHVQGRTLSGWVVADPTLTAEGILTNTRSRTASRRSTRRHGDSSRRRSVRCSSRSRGARRASCWRWRKPQIMTGRPARPDTRSPVRIPSSCAATRALSATT